MPNYRPSRLLYLTDAADIIHWSDRTEARTEFPRLIRRLILQTNDQVVQLEMRAAEGAGVPGYDGIVETSRATPFVPLGLSYWELGVGADPRTKANNDFHKRTEALGNGVKSDATFVFVTSRRWSGKTEWEAEKRSEDRWRDVRAFDVDDIEQALEQARGVHIWFSELLGKRVNGAQSLEDWWHRYSERTNPPLSPQMVLAGREDGAAEVIRLLNENSRFTSIGGPSQDDDLAFIAAAMVASGDDQHSALLSKALVVWDGGVLRSLDGASPLLLLVSPEDDLARGAELVREHRLVFLCDEDTPVDFSLAPVNQRTFLQRLVEAGMSDEEARRLSQAAHRSLKKFQRLASRDGAVQSPEWGRQLRTAVIRRAWLAGGWQSNMTGDVDVLSGLFGREYHEAVNELWQAGGGADPLFTHVGHVWAVSAPDDSWSYVRPHVNASDLDRVEKAIQTVLGAVDPALELPAEDRWKAGIFGKSRIHSSTLRKGLATTLAIFGAEGQSINLGSGATGREWAEQVIYELLERANRDTAGQLWASLSDVVPLLAEAAPDVFLRTVESGVQGPDPVLRKLFIDQYDGFSVTSPHTGLLWAIETIAWSSSHFGRAVELLARLAELDPGGRLANRPLNSLQDIFRLWYPQTSASSSARLAALQSLVLRHPVIAWDLLLALISNRDTWVLSGHGPRFRAWKPSQEGVTRKESWDYSSNVAQMILQMIEQQPERWAQAAQPLSSFPPSDRAAALEQLSQLSSTEIPDPVRAAIWEALDALLRQHRAFPQARWVLPEPELDELERVLTRLKPTDPAQRYGWLFSSDLPNIGVKKRDNFDRYLKELAKLRIDAVAEIMGHGGLTSVIELLPAVAAPMQIGVALAEIEDGPDELDVLHYLDSNDAAQANFAYGYAKGVSQGKLKTLLLLAEKFGDRPLAQARLLAASDQLPEVWSAAARLGVDVDAAYWREFQTIGRGADYALVNDAARQLTSHGRPAAALDLLCLYRDQTNDPVDPQVVVEAFETLIRNGDDEIRRLSSWEIEQLLEYLRHSPVDEGSLASLEWALLPAIGIESSSLILQRRLARDPSFFVEVLSLCYRPSSDEEQPAVHPHVATNAYRLLLDWKQIPGSDEIGGEVDAQRLNAWFAEARQLLAQADRLPVGEKHIGKVFARSQVDPDGSWPVRAVRDVIDAAVATSLDDGVVTGAINGRGVASRALDEGGDQEYALAKQYERWADGVMDQWPRTASVLRTLAGLYRAEARSHDEEAHRFNEGLDR